MTYPTAVTRDIAAPSEKVWALVTDLPRMGEWSPENAGGKWVKGATGPALGSVFQGTNKNGFRRWTTERDDRRLRAQQVFEFAVTSGPLAVATWRYEFEETDAGCRITESWVDQRKRWFAILARVAVTTARRTPNRRWRRRWPTWRPPSSSRRRRRRRVRRESGRSEIARGPVGTQSRSRRST